jgi:capsular polysaccharide transport system permease protein
MVGETAAISNLIPKALAPKARFLGIRSMVALMLREMATSYGRSPGGYLWALVDPVAALTLMSMFFAMTFHAPPLGSNFVLFYATGYLPFAMYSEVSVKVGQSIRFSKPLLAYPRVTYVDALFSRFILNCLTHLAIFSVIIGGISVIYGLRLDLNIPAILQAFGMAVALALGVGTLNCYLSSTFPLWERIWSIANRPLFLVSGVFFMVEKMGDSWRTPLLYNPLIHVISQMRAGFYPTYDAPLVSPIYVYSVAIGCLFFGMLLLNRYHKDILNEDG